MATRHVNKTGTVAYDEAWQPLAQTTQFLLRIRREYMFMFRFIDLINKWTNGVLGHDSALEGCTGQGIKWANWMILVCIMPQVQDRSLGLLTCSPVRCAMAALGYSRGRHLEFIAPQANNRSLSLCIHLS